MSSPVPLIQPPGHYMYHVSTEADYQTVMITWWPSWRKAILWEWTLESKCNLKLDVYIAVCHCRNRKDIVQDLQLGTQQWLRSEARGGKPSSDSQVLSFDRSRLSRSSCSPRVSSTGQEAGRPGTQPVGAGNHDCTHAQQPNHKQRRLSAMKRNYMSRQKEQIYRSTRLPCTTLYTCLS